MRLFPLGLAAAAMFGVSAAQTPQLVVKVEDQYPAFSPDGARIAFESRRADGVDHIFIADADGSNIRQLTDAKEDDETPVFSPDGRTILFARLLGEGRQAHLDIFAMDADGGNVRNLTNTPDAQDDHHKFSADGERIIFNSSRATPFSTLSDDAFGNYGWNYDIWVMDADGRNQRPLIELPGWDTYPSFSPDGGAILWRRVLEEGGQRNSEIFVGDSDGENIRNLTGHPAFDGYPEYSPDGRWIAFASNRGDAADKTGETFRLFIMRNDGSDVKPVTAPPEGAEDVRPSWSPDGRTLIFNRDQNGDSRIMTLEVADLVAR